MFVDLIKEKVFASGRQPLSSSPAYTSLIITYRQYGMTLIEIMIVMAILGVSASIGIVAYQGYTESSKTRTATQQIAVLSLIIDDYAQANDAYPTSLAETGNNNLLDPWGNPYQYLNITQTKGKGKVRKDHNLVPLNTDYDLYSMGKDGRSVPPLTAKSSRDDIVRANNGGFIGPASEY